MSSGFQVEWQPGSKTARWAHRGKDVVKTFETAPDAVIYWPEPPSILALEPIVEGGRLDNVVVFDPDGRERLRLKPPRVVSERSWDKGFYSIYPSGGVLVTVFQTAVGDFWGDPNLETGELRNVKQWR